MTSNCGYIRTTPGILKLIVIVLTTAILGLACGGHFGSEYTSNREKYRPFFTENELRSMWREYYLMGVAAVCLCVSTAGLVAHLVSRSIYWDRRTAYYDFAYNAGACLLLGSAGVLFIVSAVKIFEINCTTNNGCQEFQLKLGAGGLALFTAVLYGAVASVVLTNRKDVEREALMGDDK